MNNFKYKIPYPKFGNANNKSVAKNVNKLMNKIDTGISEINGSKLPFPLLIFLIIFVMFLLAYIIFYIIARCDMKKPFTQYFTDFSFDPCVYPEKPDLVPKVLEKKEVFHVANQDYTYEQAKCKCAAYGARLATKAEIIEAYNNGADWCTYGWSEGQTAYYPTQKCKWDELQRGDPKHRWDCGWPGVNGGFFANPNLKFGVNCYGVRPKQKFAKEKPAVCEGRDFCGLNFNFNAANRLETDRIAPFNENQWSEFG